MIYNKTCLFSSTAGVSGCDLSEPLSAFERYIVKVSPGVYWESTLTGNKSVQRFNRYGDWNHQGYMIWPANWVVSNNTQRMECNKFQMLSQNSAVNQVNAFGFGNSASNVKHLYEVWGINKKDYTSAIGSGSPGSAYTAYNETLLWSSNDRPSAISLSGRAIEYDRIKIGVGSDGESKNIYEVDSPTTYTSWLPLYSYWGTTTASFYLSLHRYRWGNETSGLSAISGKTFQLGTAAASPYSAGGNYTSTEGYVRRPVWAVWGINKKPIRTVTLLNGGHGSISASRITGVENDEVTISNTPDTDWYFSGYSITGATLTGNKFVFGNSDVTIQAGWTQDAFPITYEDDGHGTVTGPITAVPNSTVELTNTYNTYYRLSGYEVTGGTVEGNTLTVTGPCTVKAVFKPNAFTASGGFDKGSNLTARTYNSTTVYAQTNYLYATTSYKTSNTPTAWAATSKRWKVTSTVSGYKITLAPKMTFYGKCSNASNQLGGLATGVALIGNTQTQSQSYSTHSNSVSTWNYSKSFTSNTTGVNYGISGRIGAYGAAGNYYGSAGYNASLTTGTWTATGYAP